MQNTKDTFYRTLRDRLAALNPARVVTFNGAQRTAILVAENTPATTGFPSADCFVLHWGSAQALPQWSALERPLMTMDCRVEYWISGSSDRGRLLAAMDDELMRICAPATAAKLDCTQSPPAALGTTIFWSVPEFDAPAEDGARLKRSALVRVYFFPEVSA